jgi:creatinine amidohydrolase
VSIFFSELRSPQIKAAAEAGAVAVLPVGQTEEHGPHLPVNTDTFIIHRVCHAAIKSLHGNPQALLLDPVTYGYSQKAVTEWAGTFVVPQETLIEMLTHVVVSLADMGFRKVVIANGHGNHDGVLRVVARRVADERGIGPGLLFPYALVGDVLKEHSRGGPQAMCHACEMETSLMLHLANHLVDMSSAVSDDRLTVASPYSSGQAFVSTWTLQKSRSGTYGDPTVASPKLGRLLFEKMVAETAKFIRYYEALKQV